jgi:hypothetical protein
MTDKWEVLVFWSDKSPKSAFEANTWKELEGVIRDLRPKVEQYTIRRI